MIGYDLDGVLISDLHWSDGMTLEKFLEMRATVPCANFVPKGSYVIVTGRNSTDVEYTKAWVAKNLSVNMPYKIFHDCPDHRQAVEYKAKVISQNNISTFIESDAAQAEYLKKHCPNCNVIHLGSFISETLYNLRRNDGSA